MTYMLYGAAGTLLVLGLLALGALLGWRVRIAWVKHTGRAADVEISERARRQAEAMERAMDNMLSYSPDVAYGVTGAAPWAGEDSE